MVSCTIRQPSANLTEQEPEKLHGAGTKHSKDDDGSQDYGDEQACHCEGRCVGSRSEYVVQRTRRVLHFVVEAILCLLVLDDDLRAQLLWVALEDLHSTARQYPFSSVICTRPGHEGNGVWHTAGLSDVAGRTQPGSLVVGLRA